MSLGNPIGDKLWELSLDPKSIDNVIWNTSIFWYNIFYELCKMKKDNEHNFTSQVIWFNSNIQIDNKLCFYKTWYEKGICYIKDIWNEETGRFLTLDEIKQKYDLNVPFTVYFGLQKAISEMRKKKTVDELVTRQDPVSSQSNTRMSVTLYRKLKTNTSLLFEKFLQWQVTLQGNQLEYEEFLRAIGNIYVTMISVKLRSFQYRLCLRALITNIHLYYYNLREDKKCSFCNEENETVPHLFYHCRTVRNVWTKILNMMNIDINGVTLPQILFNNVSEKSKSVVNCIVLITKFYVYRERCLNPKISFENCKNYIMQYKNIENEIARQKGKLEQHVQKWNQFEV